MTREARNALEVFENSYELFKSVIESVGPSLFEIGRGADPDRRRIDKRYDHVIYGPGELDSDIAAKVESMLVKAFAANPHYNTKAAQHGGGGCPLKGGQWIYLVWNGNECEDGCSIHSKT